MSGSKFYQRSPQLLDLKFEYTNTARIYNQNSNNSLRTFDFEAEWEHFSGKDKHSLLDMSANAEENAEHSIVGKTPVSTDDKQEIRMQEIEEIILNSSIIRNIHGNLCLWNGRYYTQLTLQTFTQEVRNILPKALEKRISRFGRFRETYDFLQANSKLRQFSEKNIHIAQNMIVFQNGIYCGKTGEMHQFDSCYPVLFDVNAEYLGSNEVSTPYFDKIINQATGFDREILELCYQTLGYIFSQGIEAKKFFLFGTAPDSGKSIIGEFIAKILGDDKVSTISLNDFGTRFALGTINQKVLNYNMDLPATDLDKNSIQRLKVLTGDPRIECEEKYVQPKTAHHHCKFLFATNHPIKLKFNDPAFYNRLVLIPFIYSVNEHDRDYELPRKLWQERHAIVTKAAHAYSRLLSNNFIFQESALASAIVSEWKEEEDSNLLKAFFNEKCELSSDDSFVATENVFHLYREFCSSRGKNVDCLDKIQFSTVFHSLFGLKKAKRRVKGFASPVNGYVGLKLHDEIGGNCDE